MSFFGNYEHRTQPLLTTRLFAQRLLGHLLVVTVFFAASLLAGVIGYHVTEHLSWIDSLLNASMILGGMGPVSELRTVPGKLFASGYALFSGIAFLASAGILIAPVAHRAMHRLHLESPDEE